jgi:ABC-type transporter Mla maintaining outer membrane lipid asymmetry permease subunit MlaE
MTVMGFESLCVAFGSPYQIRSLIRQMDNIGVGAFVSAALSPVLTALLVTGCTGSGIALRLGRCA